MSDIKCRGLIAFWMFSFMPIMSYAHMLRPDMTVLSEGYHARRDVYGRFIAEAAYRLYSADAARCAGPAYQCRGIMVSAFETDDDYWMLTYPELSKLSLSYWAKRTTGQTRGDAAWLGTGFMLWPSAIIEKLSGGVLMKPQFTCVFATEALTGGKLHDGCGGYQDRAWPKCQTVGVHTAKEYIGRFGDKQLNACGFALGVSSAGDALAFDSALTLQLSEVKNDGGTFYNEVLMKGWNTRNPANIPLMGFFYIWGHSGLSPSGYREIAQKNQRVFYQKNHLFVPIIRVTGSDWAHVRFEYRETEQSVDIPRDIMVNADMAQIHSLPDIILTRSDKGMATRW